jgi:hypothetical protein
MDQMRGSRMVSFAAIMIMLVGAFNVLDGIVAVAKSDYFNGDLLFSDVEKWGWAFVVFGIVQFTVGAAVFGGSKTAQWLAIIIAALNALGQLAYVASYPAWSLAIIALDIVIIYSLANHGSVFAQDMADDSYREPGLTPSELRARTPHIG